MTSCGTTCRKRARRIPLRKMTSRRTTCWKRAGRIPQSRIHRRVLPAHDPTRMTHWMMMVPQMRLSRERHALPPPPMQTTVHFLWKMVLSRKRTIVIREFHLGDAAEGGGGHRADLADTADTADRADPADLADMAGTEATEGTKGLRGFVVLRACRLPFRQNATVNGIPGLTGETVQLRARPQTPKISQVPGSGSGP
jgi:hypothetical protein